MLCRRLRRNAPLGNLRASLCKMLRKTLYAEGRRGFTAGRGAFSLQFCGNLFTPRRAFPHRQRTGNDSSSAKSPKLFFY
jgi:hypothetical protein